MSISGLPFDDIRELMAQLPPADEIAGRLARERAQAIAASFCETAGDDDTGLCGWIAEWSGKSPKISRPVLALFAGTHKVAEHYGTAPGESALAIVTRLAAGGSPANQVCAASDTGLKAFDLALQFPVEDIATGEAMDEKGSAATIGFGMEAVAGGVDLLGLAGFGQGGEIASAVILAILYGGKPADWLVLPPGGAGEMAHALAVEAGDKAMERHRDARSNPLELLRRAGGREFSALAGAVLSARTQHVPVVTGGMTALAVLCLLEAEQAGSTAHCRVALPAGDALAARAADAGGIATLLQPTAGYVDGAGVAMAMAQLRMVAEIHSGTVISETD